MTPSNVTTELGAMDATEALITATGPVAGKIIIDIGSGEGAMARALAERGAEVTGVDPLGPAQGWTELGAGRYRLLREDSQPLPFADGSADLVMFIFSLHHIPPAILPGVLREAARVLRPGAPLYVAEPVAAGPVQEVACLYHDETAVRQRAAEILADNASLFREHKGLSYGNIRRYGSYEDYVTRMKANMRFNGYTEADLRAEPVRERFEAVHARVGGVFEQPVRVDVFTG